MKKGAILVIGIRVVVFVILLLIVLPVKLHASWTNTTALPDARNIPNSVVYNGYVYVIGGGYNGSAQNTVYYAPLNANGTVGVWDTTTSLPDARWCSASVVYNGYVYVICGRSENTVYYAPLNADGTVGVWNTTTSLPDVRGYSAAVVYNSYVYVIGGWDSGYNIQNTVYYASLNANGTVGVWNTTTSLPDARSDHTSAVYNGYVYTIGGWNGSAQSTVYYAPLNANGTVGVWNTTMSLPDIRCDLASVVCNGYIYAIGGEFGDDKSAQSTVYYAPLNANGTVGVWDTTYLPVAREEHASVVYNGYIYVIGGHDSSGTYYNTVWYSPCEIGVIELVNRNYGKISPSCGVPNPFTSIVNINYSVPCQGEVLRVTIYDLAGKLVRTLINERKEVGSYKVIWDGKDGIGNKMNSGVYFVKFEIEKVEEIRKVTLIR